jgi:hypothetical protein
MLGHLARIAVIFGLVGPVACYSPPEPDCGFVCGSGGACPDDYTCASDNICHRNGSSPSLMCTSASVPFDVQSVTANGSHEVDVTFDSTPNATQAVDPANYTISGLTIEGTPTLSGATVKLMTSAQSSVTYTLMVANVTRASDGKTLTTAVGTFAGVATFIVASATSVDAHTIRVTFSDPPNSSQAVDPANYAIDGGLTVTGTPMLSGSSVTIGTSAQAAQMYTVTVTNVKRASDFEVLDTNTAMFTGRTPFNVTGASTITTIEIQITFSAPPEPTSATTVGNYTFGGGLMAMGTPVLSGSMVTLTTSAQAAQGYTLTVANVTRTSDGEPLSTATAMFTGVSCMDAMQDGDETDVDCGGSVCAACANGKKCVQNADCQSNNCSGMTCAP